jgi:hypothetical protein
MVKETPKMFCADLTLSLSAQSMAILHLLADREVGFASLDEDNQPLCQIQSYAWYNGREKGVALIVWYGSVTAGPCYIIAFGEDRGSDRIFIDSWYEPMAPLNGPTIDLRGAHGRGFRRENLKGSETAKAADRVYSLMSEFVQSKGKITPIRKGKKS